MKKLKLIPKATRIEARLRALEDMVYREFLKRIIELEKATHLRIENTSATNNPKIEKRNYKNEPEVKAIET